MQINVVMGRTGEYSDRIEWPVKAFKSKEKAQQFVVACTEIAKEIEVRLVRLGPEGMYSISSPHHALDPQFRMYYTGTFYFIYEVDLDEYNLQANGQDFDG